MYWLIAPALAMLAGKLVPNPAAAALAAAAFAAAYLSAREHARRMGEETKARTREMRERLLDMQDEVSRCKERIKTLLEEKERLEREIFNLREQLAGDRVKEMEYLLKKAAEAELE